MTEQTKTTAKTTIRQMAILDALLRNNAITDTAGQFYLLGGHGAVNIRFNSATLPAMCRLGLLTRERGGIYYITDIGRALAKASST